MLYEVITFRADLVDEFLHVGIAYTERPVGDEAELPPPGAVVLLEDLGAGDVASYNFV